MLYADDHGCEVDTGSIQPEVEGHGSVSYNAKTSDKGLVKSYIHQPNDDILDYIMLNDNRLSHRLTWKQIGNKRTGITHGAVGPTYFINDNNSLELMWSANI